MSKNDALKEYDAWLSAIKEGSRIPTLEEYVYFQVLLESSGANSSQIYWALNSVDYDYVYNILMEAIQRFEIKNPAIRALADDTNMKMCALSGCGKYFRRKDRRIYCSAKYAGVASSRKYLARKKERSREGERE